MNMSEVVVNVLKEDNTPKTPEEVEQERQHIIAAGDTPIVPGSKTDSALLLVSLQDTRKKLKEAEDKLEGLQTNPHASPDITTEAAKELREEIDKANSRIAELSRQGTLKDLYMQYPALKDKSDEFETYLADPDNDGMSMATAAKAYMIENEIPVRRIGLEKPTGGERVPAPTGMTVDDIRILRETNFPKYKQLLGKGLIKI